MKVSWVNRAVRKFDHLTHRTYHLPHFADDTRRLYLFDTVEHGNYGDHAITVAELAFFEHLSSPWRVVPIRGSQVDSAIPVVKSVIRPQDVVVCHGGGNMGDIWVTHEQRRQKVLATFHDNKLVSMPQSTSYEVDGETLKNAIAILKTCRDVTIFARDAVSYEFMVTHFPDNVRCYLVPDIVLSLQHYQTSTARSGVTTFFRRDQEKQPNPRMAALVTRLTALSPIAYSDTVDSKRVFITPRMRKPLLARKFDQFRQSRLVVTDRLHGAIFATITGTPAIVFDNNNHKIKYSFDSWLKRVNYVLFADNYTDEELDQFVASALKGTVTAEVPDFSDDFSPLRSAFR